MNQTTERAMTRLGTARSRFWRVLPPVGVLSLLLVLAFEVGIRHVPPDGLTVSYEFGPSLNGPMRTTYTAPQDQQVINTYYAALNATPVRPSPWPTNIDGCSPSEYPQFTFTWHGIPVESWSGYCVVIESAGGLSDDFIGAYHFWAPPTGPLHGPPPPPASR